ncbi:MAG: TatD family deoxyribonuclease [Cyanobacteria bacterium J083]|nr:MAG: TatD family deoxyribonuclease [Cyanobacteria bacterium J083]
MQLIDTHVHINFEIFQKELNSVRQRWRDAGVVHLVHSCVEPSEFQSMQAIADRYPEVSLAVGLHPLDADKWTSKMADQIYSLAKSDQRVVAIGETGLDYYKAENQQQQKEILVAQLAIATKLDKPVIIHCRQAASDLREILQTFRHQGKQIRGVMHCWTGNVTETKWFLDLGFYVSFSGIVTFKNAKEIQAVAKIVPDERLLIETDCPFLAPVPQRGKRNEPAYVRYVAEYLANLRGVTLQQLAEQTTANAIKLFGINLSSSY